MRGQRDRRVDQPSHAYQMDLRRGPVCWRRWACRSFLPVTGRWHCCGGRGFRRWHPGIVIRRRVSPVLVGGCVDLGATGLPYAPFTAALRELVRQRGAGQVAGLLPGGAAGELASLLPELGSPPAEGDPEMS